MLLALRVALVGVGAVIGFLAPGMLIADVLRSRDRFSAGFLISLLLLFHGVLLCDVLHIPLSIETVGAWELAVLLIALAAWKRWHGTPPEARTPFAWQRVPAAHWVIVGALVLVAAAIVIRITIAPLSGYDTIFRWDFLAQKMLERRSLTFYPPRSAADFRAYFFVDGIAPLVSTPYWWLYALNHAYAPALSAIFVGLQCVVLALLVARAAARLSGQRSGGLWALALLSAAPLFLWSITIGQETALTAIALAGVLCFLLGAGPDDWRPAVLAGTAAAVGALAREYGAVFILCGLLVMLCQRQRPRVMAVFVATAGALAAPWYLREWFVTGNPVYSLRVANLFTINPAYDAMMRSWSQQLSVVHYSSHRWAQLGIFILQETWPVTLVGLAAAMLALCRRPYLLVLPAIVTLVYLYSISFTAGGPGYASRVLSPALAILAIAGGALLARLGAWQAGRWLAGLILVPAMLYSIAALAVFPGAPQQMQGGKLVHEIFAPQRWQSMGLAMDQAVRTKLPPGTRVLMESPYLHPYLQHSAWEAVPAWSPEVAFIYDTRLSATEVRARLLERGIGAVMLDWSPAANPWLAGLPFFAQDKFAWNVRANVPGQFTLCLLPPVVATTQPSGR